MNDHREPNTRAVRAGFSLVEVLLALGVFSIAVLALLALMGALLADLRDARGDASAESVLALASLHAREEAHEWETILAGGGTVVRFVLPPQPGEGAEDGGRAAFVVDEDGLRARLHAGGGIVGTVTELRGRAEPPTAMAGGSHRVLVFEARQLAALGPDGDPDALLARFRGLSPEFTFPVLIRP